MNSLDDFWRSFFGEGISNFEEILMMRGAMFMTPEEPQYAVFVMMVRVLHQTQGETEKALLRFAPELIRQAETILEAFVALESRLVRLRQLADELRGNLFVTKSQAVGLRPIEIPSRENGMTEWIRSNFGPVATTTLTFAFCLGFLIATFVNH